MTKAKTGAELLVECLEKQGVEYIFGIPGAKVDAIFNVLADRGPKLILCRHEQNAAFMAACVGRLTGKPGVVLVTSGPGVSNLTTGLATATTEGDPVVALGGAVPRAMRLKQTHQSMDNVSVMAPVTKHSVEITVPESIPEVLANAFRIANEPRAGASFVSLPADILQSEVEQDAMEPVPHFSAGPAPEAAIAQAAQLIEEAELPVLFLGMESSRPENTEVVRELLSKHPLATVETYEAAGVLSQELLDCFVGRVGLFKNQPGDELLQAADLVLTVGFDPVEYDPVVWNARQSFTLIHLDANRADIDQYYRPDLELIGDVTASLQSLSRQLSKRSDLKRPELVSSLRQKMASGTERGQKMTGIPIHPLRIITDMQKTLSEDVMVISDVGSHYMWLARHFYSFRPHHLLFSNGQQTLGVALPWAMAATLIDPNKKVVSVSGDGGFLFSAMELENAVRQKCSFVHCVWRDGGYDMVACQEKMKYGREYGVRFGQVDLIKFAESFGARGMAVEQADDFIPLLKEAMAQPGPVLLDIPIDYSDNDGLFATLNCDGGH